jgi:hypothetical protein
MAKSECKEGLVVTPLGGSNEVLVHEADHTIATGTLRPAFDGAPMIPGERLVFRHPDGTYSDSPSSTTAGPPKVNSAAFREGWARVFGEQKVGRA